MVGGLLVNRCWLLDVDTDDIDTVVIDPPAHIVMIELNAVYPQIIGFSPVGGAWVTAQQIFDELLQGCRVRILRQHLLCRFTKVDPNVQFLAVASVGVVSLG